MSHLNTFLFKMLLFYSKCNIYNLIVSLPSLMWEIGTIKCYISQYLQGKMLHWNVECDITNKCHIFEYDYLSLNVKR